MLSPWLEYHAIWFQRKIILLIDQSLCTGPMFKSVPVGKKMSINEMDEFFHSILLEVQRRYPKILPDLSKVAEDNNINIYSKSLQNA
jgi:hypothetical protein